MLQKKGKVVTEGNDPTRQDVYVMITWEELRRVLSESMGKAFGELKEDLKWIDQRLVSLKQDDRQPCLAPVADVPADKKNRERAEGAATTVQAKHGESCFAKRVQAGPKSSTSSGDDFTGPPALLCSRDDALVGNGIATPKSRLSPLEMRTPTATGGLLPAVITSTAKRITFNQLPLRFCSTEDTNSERTSIQYAAHYRGFW